MTRETANAIYAQIKRIRAEADDKLVSEMPALLPTLKGNGELVRAGTRINWNGTVKKAAVDLWDRTENDPDHAPALWQDISYRDGIRIIPSVITVTEAFALGERGWWEDELYESLLSANVYTPAAYPRGWKKVTEE